MTAESAYKTPHAATTERRISESVYQVLVYLESRAVQRARHRRAALGAKEDPSHRRWKRRVYQLVRRRIGEYLATAGTAKHPSLPTGTTEEEVGLPKAERRDRTRTEKGRAYLQRRRTNFRQKTRAKEKAKRAAKKVDEKPRWESWREADREEKRATEGSAWSGGAPAAAWSSASASAWWSSSSAADRSSAPAGGAMSERRAKAKEQYMAQFRPGYQDDREEALKRHLRTPSPTERMRSSMQAASSSSAAPVQEERCDTEDTDETDTEQDAYEDLYELQEKQDAEKERNRVRKIEARITEIYQQLYDEGKASWHKVMEVPQLMEKYRDQEEELLESVRTEYNLHMESSELPQSTPTNRVEEELEDMSKAYGDMGSTPMEEEGLDEPVLPARHIAALDKDYITSYMQDHWAHSKRMTHSNKPEFERLLYSAKVAGAPLVEVTETDVASHLAAMKFPMEELCPPEKMKEAPIEEGPGQWFRVDIRHQHVRWMNAWAEEHPNGEWTFAVHGTSMRAAKAILYNGWREASNVTGGVHGLYCEGMHRRQCTMRYMTHAWEKSLPKWCVAAAMLELMVDKSDTKVINRQWVQRNLGSATIVAMLIHVVDLREVFPAKFLGWMQVAGRTMKDMEIEARPAVELRAKPA